MTNPTYKIPSMIKTSTGLRVDPLSPDPKSVKLEDVLTALGRQIRYNGHVDYSVRDHTRVMYEIYMAMRRPAVEFCAQLPVGDLPGQMPRSDEFIAHLMGLLILTHDMPEAYIGDMVQPLKVDMPAFKAVDDRILPIVMRGIIGEALEPTFGAETEAHQVYLDKIMRMFTDEADVNLTNYLTHSLNLLDRNICDHLEMPCLHGPLERLTQDHEGAAKLDIERFLLTSYLLNYAQSTKATLDDRYELAEIEDPISLLMNRLTAGGRAARRSLSPEHLLADDLEFFRAAIENHVTELCFFIAFTFTEKDAELLSNYGVDIAIAKGLATPSKPWDKAAFMERMRQAMPNKFQSPIHIEPGLTIQWVERSPNPDLADALAFAHVNRGGAMPVVTTTVLDNGAVVTLTKTETGETLEISNNSTDLRKIDSTGRIVVDDKGQPIGVMVGEPVAVSRSQETRYMLFLNLEIEGGDLITPCNPMGAHCDQVELSTPAEQLAKTLGRYLHQSLVSLRDGQEAAVFLRNGIAAKTYQMESPKSIGAQILFRLKKKDGFKDQAHFETNMFRLNGLLFKFFSSMKLTGRTSVQVGSASISINEPAGLVGDSLVTTYLDGELSSTEQGVTFGFKGQAVEHEWSDQ